MGNSGAGPTNKYVTAQSAREQSMSMGILALVAGGLVLGFLVVIAVLLFRRND